MKALNRIIGILLVIGLTFFQSCKDEELINQVTAGFSANKTSIIEGEEVMFSSTSNLNVESWEWTFEGGTPATSTNQTPTIRYNTAGSYKVKLLVKSENAEDELEILGFITVDDFLPVTADFTADKEQIKEGESISFTSTSNTNVTSWEWTFEGGNPATSTEQNPTVTWGNEGDYNVTLKVSSANDESTLEKSKWINVRHTADTRSIAFDGVDDFIDAGTLPDLNTPNKVSVSAWIKTAVKHQKNKHIAGSTNGSVDYYIGINNAGGLEVAAEGWSISGGIIHDDDKWHHVVLVYDAGIITRYLDNSDPFISNSGRPQLTLPGNAVTIGGKSDGTATFDGQIAEVTIWSKALSTEEVNALYNNCQLLGSEDGLIGYWDFNTNTSAINNVAYSTNAEFKNGNTPTAPNILTDVPVECQ